MDFNGIPAIDEATVRRFVEIIHTHAAQAINGADQAGVLQMCRINPTDESAVTPSRFEIGDVDAMVKAGLEAANAGHNVYIEARTVSPELRGKQRGTLEQTAWVLGFVVDSDADKGKAGCVTAEPTLEVETSPGNRHLWYLLEQAIPAAEAKVIGEAIRKGSGADADTGVITQCYRVAGTPNFPSAAKRTRGRCTVEATRIISHSGRLWAPDELAAAYSSVSPEAEEYCNASADDGDETTLPPDLLRLIRDGVSGIEDRSAVFHSVVARLKRRRWSVEAIVALFERYPNGIAHKYLGRIRAEVERSYDKHDNLPPSGPGATARALPTIRITAGQMPRAVAATEQALLSAGAPMFFRAGTLVRPCIEKAKASDGRTTTIATLHPFVVPLLLVWMADAAVFERFDGRRRGWVVIDPPRELAEALLAQKGMWRAPHVSGIITTPTLRADGSLLAAKGHDAATGLYLNSSLELAMPEPTRAAAQAGLALLVDLLGEFSFVRPLDRAVALAGLLTALVRGVLPTAPMFLIRAHTPGTGKSYLVDLISAIATGQVCAVITASTNKEEFEKRLGAIILSGVALTSIDNCMRDLSGELLCQLAERSRIKIRVLGRSEMPECECHTTVFATGNNILLKGDLVRRGLVCDLDALDERPELREFKHDPLRQVLDDRAPYVAAALTIMRAYLAAGAPRVCGALGSYPEWSRMVRSPLVWLGEADPVGSMDSARDEDPELGAIRELFELWTEHLALNERYTTGRLIEVACEPPAAGDFNQQPFKELLFRMASNRDGTGISSERLGWWLRGISGRIVAGHRLNMGYLNKAKACFWLAQVAPPGGSPPEPPQSPSPPTSAPSSASPALSAPPAPPSASSAPSAGEMPPAPPAAPPTPARARCFVDWGAPLAERLDAAPSDSPNVDPLVYWITERDAMRRRLHAGEPRPGTTDEFLAKFRFCNINVQDDRISRIIFEQITQPHADHPHLLVALTFCRLCNEPEMFAAALPALFPFDPATLTAIVVDRHERGLPLERRAYRIPRANEDPIKMRGLIDEVLAPLANDIEHVRQRAGDSVAAVFHRLRGFDRSQEGSPILKKGFITAQIVRDVKQIEPLRSAPDWQTFVWSGPGSRQCIDALYGYSVKEAKAREKARSNWDDDDERRWREEHFLPVVELARPQVPGVKIDDLASWQNCGCETFKLIKYRSGDFGGARRYTPHSEKPARRHRKNRHDGG
jgi:hypothetical protein